MPRRIAFGHGFAPWALPGGGAVAALPPLSAGASLQTLTPSVQAALYPNRPAGMSLLDQWDGTSITKANWTELGAPWNTKATVEDDSTNPLGTNKVIQVSFQPGDTNAGAPTRNTFAGGPFSEYYIMYRIKYSANWQQLGHKHFYWGSPVGSRQNEGCGPCCFFTTHEANGQSNVGDQHGAVTEWVIQASNYWDDPDDFGVWVNMEYHFICNSAPGADDGAAYLYRNGVLVGQGLAHDWVPAGEAEAGFDGFHWYHQRNDQHTQSENYRIGELAIFGKN